MHPLMLLLNYHISVSIKQFDFVNLVSRKEKADSLSMHLLYFHKSDIKHCVTWCYVQPCSSRWLHLKKNATVHLHLYDMCNSKPDYVSIHCWSLVSI